MDDAPSSSSSEDVALEASSPSLRPPPKELTVRALPAGDAVAAASALSSKPGDSASAPATAAEAAPVPRSAGLPGATAPPEGLLLKTGLSTIGPAPNRTAAAGGGAIAAASCALEAPPAASGQCACRKGDSEPEREDTAPMVPAGTGDLAANVGDAAPSPSCGGRLYRKTNANREKCEAEH